MARLFPEARELAVGPELWARLEAEDPRDEGLPIGEVLSGPTGSFTVVPTARRVNGVPLTRVMPEPAVACGYLMELRNRERDAVVARLRIPGRRQYRIRYEGRVFDQVDVQPDGAVYAEQ